MENIKLSGTLLFTEMAERNTVTFCLNSDAFETFKHKSLILLFENQTYKTSHVRVIYSWLLALALVTEPFCLQFTAKQVFLGIMSSFWMKTDKAGQTLVHSSGFLLSIIIVSFSLQGK